MEGPHHSQRHCSTRPGDCGWVVGRREFLRASVVSVVGAGLSQLSCAVRRSADQRHRTVRFGIVADCHYADADPAGSRYYRQSLDKLVECIESMNARKVDFVIELGDFKDQDNPPAEEKTLEYLRAVERVFRMFKGPRYHVLGNHDPDSISKGQFLSNVGNTGIDADKTYYSFDFNGVHFVVLDANYRADDADYDHGNFDWADANIPPAELEWLRRDLESSRGPAIILVHQLLDGAGPHYVKNAAEVRAVLQSSNRVLAVFQGHQHSGGYSQIEGIHYYTLRAVVEGPGLENNSYAVVEVRAEGHIIITGYRKAVGVRLQPAAV